MTLLSSRCAISAPQSKHGDVVGLLSPSNKAAHVIDDCGDKVPGIVGRGFCQRLGQPIMAIKRILRILGFSDAVRKKQQYLAGCDAVLIDRIEKIVGCPERRAPFRCQLPQAPVAAEDEG